VGLEPGGAAGKLARRRRRWRLAAIVAAVVLALVFGVGQLVLPSLAAEAVQEELAHYGTVGSVSVSATPAVELLFEAAQAVRAKAVELALPIGELVKLARRLGGVDEGRLQVARLAVGLRGAITGTVVLHGAVLEKRGSALSASGEVGLSDIRLALPGGVQVEGVRAREGLPELLVGARIGPLALGAGGVAQASEGAIVATPAGFGPLGSLARVELFSNRSIYVESVQASPAREGVEVTVRARLV